MNYYSYTNLIKKPTRTTETTNILLDLILVSNLTIADHKFIYAVYNLIPKKQNPLILKFHSFKNTNLDQLRKVLDIRKHK